MGRLRNRIEKSDGLSPQDVAILRKEANRVEVEYLDLEQLKASASELSLLQRTDELVREKAEQLSKRIQNTLGSRLAKLQRQNPIEDAEVASVTRNPYGIEYISNPSERVQLAAIRMDPDTLRFIQNPTPKVIREAKNATPTLKGFNLFS